MSPAERPLSPVRKTPRHLLHVSLAGVAIALAATLGSGLAAADQTPITVYSDQARVLPIHGAPATAIVGNPMFADAKVRPGMIVLQGRHFGTTNVLVLDASGKELANYQVTVQQTPNARVTIFQAGGTVTYTCANNCETTLEVGDATGHFDEIQKEMTAKYGMATGANQAAK